MDENCTYDLHTTILLSTVIVMFNQPTIFEETSEVVVQYNCSTAYVPATDVKLDLNLTVGSVPYEKSVLCENETIRLPVDLSLIHI